MTPVTGWTEQSYYVASRAARQAWQHTNQQLELGLEEIDAGTVTSDGVGLLEPVPPHASPSGTGSTPH